MRSILNVFGAKALGLLLLILVAACAASPRRTAKVPSAAPTLTVDYVLAPVPEDAEPDAPSQEPAAQLRRAWILLQRRRTQDAIDACALVLYGREAASPQAEAFARYIRAAAFDASGQAQRGAYDRQRVRELALDSRLLRRLDAEAADPAPALQLDESPNRSPVAVLPRTDWRPMSPIQSRLEPMGKIYRITVHHSAMLFRDTKAGTAANQLRVIQKNHMQSPDRRYGDIGYHFLIDPAGRVWQGRELRYQGAHARGDHNIGNIGICLLGNFIRGGDGQRPNDQALRSLRTLVADLARRYGVSGQELHCHSDFVTTECPGVYLEAEVQRIAQSLGSRPRVAAAE